MKFSANISLSASKLLAYGIFICGATYSFMFKDVSALTTCATISGGVIAIKTGSTAYVSGSELKFAAPASAQVSSTAE